MVEWALDRPDEGALMAKVNTNIFTLLPLTGWQHLLIGQLQGGIHMIDLKDHSEKKHLVFHQKGVFDLELIDNGSKLLAVGGDGVLSAWDTDTFELIKSFKISEKGLRAIALHPNKPEMAVASSDGNIYLLSTKDFSLLYTMEHHKNSVFSLDFSENGNKLYAGSRDAFLSVWNAEAGYELSESIGAHMYTLNSVRLSPDGRLLATASRDKTVRLWNTQNNELVKVINLEKEEAHTNSVNALLWLDNETLLTAGDDRTINAWKIEVKF